MENLFGTVGTHDPSYLLASNYDTDAISISVEPGNGIIPAGAVMYRKSGVLYAPAASANIIDDNNLVVLRDDIDSTTSETVAVAAAAYRKAKFISGMVKVKNGLNYEAISASHAIVLRRQNLELSPMDDWSGAAVEADNTKTVNITVTNDSHGTGSASPASGTKGTEVTLTATPESGYGFDAWEVVSGDVAVENNKFTIGDSAVTVKAKFKLLPAVTVTNDGHGTGSASPAYGASGTEITLTATPADTYEFDEWEVVSGGVTIQNNKFTIGNSDVTVKAKFRVAG